MAGGEGGAEARPGHLIVAVIIGLIAIAALALAVRPHEGPGPTWSRAALSAAGSPTALCLAGLHQFLNSPGEKVELQVLRDARGWYAVDGHVSGLRDGRQVREKVHCTLVPDSRSEGGIRLADWSGAPAG